MALFNTAFVILFNAIALRGSQEDNLDELLSYLLIVIAFLLLLILALLISGYRRNLKSLKTLTRLEIQREAFLNEDNDLLYMNDENDNIVFSNKSIEAFYGTTETQISELAGIDKTILMTKKTFEADIKVASKHFKIRKFPIILLTGKPGVGTISKDITQNVRQLERIEKDNTRNKILLEISESQIDTLQNFLDHALDKAIMTSESEIGFLYIFDEEAEGFTLSAWSSNIWYQCDLTERNTFYHLGKAGLWAESVRQKRPIIINDYKNYTGHGKKGVPDEHLKIIRLMSIPITLHGKIVALAAFANKQGEYDENDLLHTQTLLNSIWNITERKTAALELAMERNLHLATLLSISDSVITVDNNKEIKMINKAAESMTGKDFVTLEDKKLSSVFGPDSAIIIEKIIDEAFQKRTKDYGEKTDNEISLRTAHGKSFVVEFSVSPIVNDDKSLSGAVLVFRDITEKKLQREHIEYISFHDSLTGLYNRRYFEEELKRVDNDRNFPLSIIIADLNGLKLANDLYGHLIGDELLITAAKILQRCLRKNDMIARWGGDEFVILLPKANNDIVFEMSSRFEEVIKKTKLESAVLSVSFGYATKQHKSENIFDIFKEAEDMMYRNKSKDSDRRSMIHDYLEMLKNRK